MEKILFIENDDKEWPGIMGILRDSHYEVILARTREKAQVSLLEHHPVLIILNPKTVGIKDTDDEEDMTECLAFLKRVRSLPPIIVYSNIRSELKNWITKYLRPQFSGWVKKSNSTELLNLVGQVISLPDIIMKWERVEGEWKYAIIINDEVLCKYDDEMECFGSFDTIQRALKAIGCKKMGETKCWHVEPGQLTRDRICFSFKR